MGYDSSMKKQTLTIRQIQNVMDWSYPTALKFATESGTKNDNEYGPDMWLVPIEAIEQKINERESAVRVMRDKLAQYKYGKA